MAENTVTPPESTRIAECSENAIAVADKCIHTWTSGKCIHCPYNRYVIPHLVLG